MKSHIKTHVSWVKAVTAARRATATCNQDRASSRTASQTNLGIVETANQIRKENWHNITQYKQSILHTSYRQQMMDSFNTSRLHLAVIKNSCKSNKHLRKPD